jgi:8-oxo-dGTP diphosphatase
MKLEISSGGIIYRKGKGKLEIALVLDGFGRWTFPKGHIEKGEKPEEAGLREVGEEIGIHDLKIIKILKKIDYWFKLEGTLIHKYVYFFLMEAPPGAKLTFQKAELKDARWFTPQNALETLDYKKDNTPLLKKAIENLV